MKQHIIEYDATNPRSIEQYARKLLNKSLKDILGDEIKQSYRGKGKLGQILEDLYFDYKPNSSTEPDFEKARVELKTTPLKKSSKGIVSKERLVFNIINYNEEYKTAFNESSFWKKNQLLLLMFYLYEKEKVDVEYIFKIIGLWQFPANDLKIIKDDWTKIVEKIKQGKAHEISEGDTLYLGACTKGANKNTKRDQPFSTIKATQRAFSLKSKYLNFIISSYLSNQVIDIDYSEYDKILESTTTDKLTDYTSLYTKLKPSSDKYQPIVKNINEYITKEETIEELIIRKFKPYYGKSHQEIIETLGLTNTNAKNKFHILSKAILGINKEKEIEEFEKADILLKTIRLEKTGRIKESMSFAQIKYNEIVEEEWDESYWYETLTKRFFFVVFKKDEAGNLILDKVLFWTMPNDDLEIAKIFWLDTQKKIENDDYDHFIKMSDNKICHVRPKAINAKDKTLTPSGRMEKKKCYWLNAKYIKNIISS